jgi:hypothetical protein
MDTSRIDGVKAPQHFKTPRSRFIYYFTHLVLRDALDGDVGHGLFLSSFKHLGVLAGADLVEDVVLVHCLFLVLLCGLWASAPQR